jgi:hypothetical protein
VLRPHSWRVRADGAGRGVAGGFEDHFDPDDDYLVALAREAGADRIVTEDPPTRSRSSGRRCRSCHPASSSPSSSGLEAGSADVSVEKAAVAPRQRAASATRARFRRAGGEVAAVEEVALFDSRRDEAAEATAEVLGDRSGAGPGR